MPDALRDVDRQIFAVLQKAAAAGVLCPGNRELADRFGLRSVASIADALHRLERAGLIQVERYTSARRVVIVETGAATAQPAGRRRNNFRARNGRGGKTAEEEVERRLEAGHSLRQIVAETGISASVAEKIAGRLLTLSVARRRLREQVRAMTRTGQDWRVLAMVLSTNIRFTLAGARDQSVSRRDPEDPGVAFYFELDGTPHALACDRWTTVQDNVAAIAAHIEALRGQERWGVADLRQAFAGHVALPRPGDHAAAAWWEVLGVRPDAGRAEIDAAWREQMRAAHPDRGGTNEAAARLNRARQEGRKANGL